LARTVAKDYDDKRRLILTRAAQLFADEGFDRASVSSVAEACKISKANIYHYYKGKDDILFDILDNYLTGLRARICEMDLGAMGPEARLEATVLEVLLAYQGADHEHRLQVSGLTYLSQERRGVLQGIQRDLVAHVSGIVEAVAPEVFAGDRDKLRAATMSLFGMLNWFYMWNSDADAQARRAYAGLVSGLCLRGFRGL